MTATPADPALSRITDPAAVYNRVPSPTVDFWIVKLLAVTVGETAADLMAQTLGLGLTYTSWIMGVVTIGVLIWQLRQDRYVPWIYWLTVVLISVVGTLITDNLVDNLGVALGTTTIAFTLALGATFAVWYGIEKTLSIHKVFTVQREAFYWLAILFTFALGTSAGDQLAESLGLGFLQSGLIFGAVIAVVAFGYYALKMNGILAFWLAYIFTRPLGASFGDLLSQSPADGGLGVGTIGTSLVFLGCIAATIVYMTIYRPGEETAADALQHP